MAEYKVTHAEGLIGILLPDMPDDRTASDLKALRALFGPRGYNPGFPLSRKRLPLSDAAARHGSPQHTDHAVSTASTAVTVAPERADQ